MTLAECAAPERYSTQIGPFGSALKAEAYKSTGVPLLRGVNVNQGRFHDEDFVFIDEATATRLSRYECGPRDVLLVHRGTLGRIGLIPDSPRFPRYIMGNSMLRVRTDPTKLLPQYLYYWLTSADGQQYLFSRTSQVGVPAIPRPLATLRQLVLPVPPIPEQRGIAGVLGAIDDKIESNQRIVAAASDGLHSVSETIADLPSVPLSDLVTSSRDTVDPSTIEAARVEHFSIPAFDVDATPEETDPSTIKSGKFAVRGPRVLVSRLNPRTPRVWYAVPSAGVGLSSTEFLVLDAATNCSLATVWLAVTDEPFTAEMQRRATGTSGSHQRIRPADALAIEVPDVRLADPALLAEVDALLRATHQARVESHALVDLRDALLPELMSGRIRVPEASQEADAVR